jgi:uncharacterized protein (UPF0261 family)
MSSKPKVLMIVTLDTKAVEAQFVRQTLEAEGVDVVRLCNGATRAIRSFPWWRLSRKSVNF